MGIKGMFRWLILVVMPLLLLGGCGDLEPDMHDTRTVSLNMDLHRESYSRSRSIVSAFELSQYNTHLILALPSWENLTSSYKNFYSSFAQGLLNPADKKVSLEIPLNTEMKLFAFLFKGNYSMYELFSGTFEVAYYGESQTFSIYEQTNNLSLGINLKQVPDPGDDTDEEDTDTDEGDTDTSGEDTDISGEDITDNNETVNNETEEEEVVADLTLLAHYKFEGDLTDNTSYVRHLTNYPTGFTFSNPDNISGKAAWFSGNKYAYTDNISIEDTDNYTIAFWIKPFSASMNAWDSVMSSGDQTSNGRFQIDYSGQDKLRFLTQGHTISIDLEALEWQHFVFTKQFIPNYVMTYNHVLSYYKDGEYLDNKTQVETRWDKIKIGLNRSGGGYWIGFIDDFRIYNRTLTADEVEELYESYE